MRPWTDLSKIDTPAKIEALAKDERGYPIFFTVLLDSYGKPNFRAQDTDKVAHALRESLCGICGHKLGRYVAFVGGPKSIKSRYFTDGAMHESCAIYALKVCPFIAAPKFAYRNINPADLHVNSLVSADRPDHFGLGITTKYKIVNLHGESVIKAGRFTRVQLWKEGQPLV